MPFFVNGGGRATPTSSPAGFRRSQAEDDSGAGSGVETPHFGIGAAKKVGLGAVAPSPSSGRGGYGGGGGRGGYMGSNSLLKPVKFVKAGTMFTEGDVAVVVQDQPKVGEGELQPLSLPYFPACSGD